VLVVDCLFFINQTLFRAYRDKIHWSAFESFCDNRSVKVNIRIFVTSFLNWVEKRVILEIRPGVEEREENLLIWSHCVLERPFDPSLIEFLKMRQILQSPMCLSSTWSFSIQWYFPNGKLAQGRHIRDETKSSNCILDFAYFWSWKWQ
jgi:hypothetical protein